MIIAATGHRPHKLGQEYDYIGPYSDYLRQETRKHLVELKTTTGISGMALGFDTIFALMCIELKIPVIAAVPFFGQEKKWPYKSQKLYHEILNNPLVTKKIICEGGYSSSKMYQRDVWMVDNSNLLLSAWSGSRGGTMNTVRYAESINHKNININPEGWRPKEPEIPTLF